MWHCAINQPLRSRSCRGGVPLPWSTPHTRVRSGCSQPGRVYPSVPPSHVGILTQRCRTECFRTLPSGNGQGVSLAKAFATAGSTPSHRMSTESATRPASIVHGERIGRYSAFRSTQRELTTKRPATTPTPCPKSPKVTVAISSGKSSSSSITLPQQDNESTRERNPISPTVFDISPLSPPLVVRGSTSPAGENEIAGVESADSHVSSHDGTSRNQTFDKDLKEKVWEIAQKFSESPGMLLRLRKSGLSRGRIVVLTTEAVAQRCKTATCTKSTARDVSALVRFYLDNRPADNITLTGEASVVLLHDYLEQAAERGRTVPGAVMLSLSCWAAALQIDWPLDRPLICDSSTVESNASPKQAHPMDIETVKLIDELALNCAPPIQTRFRRLGSAHVLRDPSFCGRATASFVPHQ